MIVYRRAWLGPAGALLSSAHPAGQAAPAGPVPG